jgi:hypothetical protein
MCDRLSRTTTDDKAKLAALKFLGHWIGDLHQPLHVSFEDDRGGGRVLTSGPCGLNLHAVWDGCIVAMKLGSDWASCGSRSVEGHQAERPGSVDRHPGRGLGHRVRCGPTPTHFGT